MMRSITRRFAAALWLLLTATLLLTGPGSAFADDILDQQKRINVVRTQELKVKVRNALVDATVLAKTAPAKATDRLKEVRSQVEDARFLAEDDRRDLLRTLDGEIRRYGVRAGLVDRQAADRAALEAAARDRLRQLERDAEKAADLTHMQRQAYELKREGKFGEANEVYERMARKYGRSPISVSGLRTTRITDNLETMRRIRNERDQRYVKAMQEVVRSSMPIIGDVEFPKDWREKTLRRTKPRLTEAEQKLLKALNTPISVTIKDKPLESVIEYLEKTTGLSISVDSPVLEAAMISLETPVSINSRQVTTRTVLKKILSKVGLTFVIRNESLFVTTPEKASTMLVTRTYYVGDLLGLTDLRFGPGFTQLQMVQNVGALIDFIQSIDPTSWRAGGGFGSIVFEPITMSLIVKQTAEMQYVLMGGLRP